MHIMLELGINEGNPSIWLTRDFYQRIKEDKYLYETFLPLKKQYVVVNTLYICACYVPFQTDKSKSVFLCISIHDKNDIPIIPGKTFTKKVCHSMSFGNEIILHVCKLSFNFSIPTKCTTIIILRWYTMRRFPTW